jgi:hypothetical protein
MNLRSVLETEDDDWPDPEDEDDVDDEEEDDDDEPEEGTWQVDGSGRSLDFSVMKSL